MPERPSSPRRVDPPRRLFRQRAVDRYLQAEREIVLPPSTRRRTFVALWVLAIVLLLAAGAVVGHLARRLPAGGVEPHGPAARIDTRREEAAGAASADAAGAADAADAAASRAAAPDGRC